MRFPSFAFAAIAGLWQQPLSPEEETTTSTRHIHVTKTVTNLASTVYAVRMGTSTVYMEYLPATLKTKSVPWQALPTTHLELRSEGEATSTMHIKVTQTVAQIQSTVFASKVGMSVSTITNVPQSRIEEAVDDAAELSSSQLAAAISSAKSDALAHSTVAVLAGNAALPSPTQPVLAQLANSSSASTSKQPAVTSPSSSSATMLPIGLELRSNGATTTTGQQQGTSVEAPDTVVAVIFGSSTSIMTSVPPTLLAAIASSQAPATVVTSVARQSTSSADPTQITQTRGSPEAVDTNAAQVKSTQTGLLQASFSSDEIPATSSPVSSTSTSSSRTSSSEVIFSTGSTPATSNKIYTIPVSTTSTTSQSSTSSSTVQSATQTSASSPSLTVYGSQSSASASAADIAADNAAGASGDDSGSFKLSKAGFAAIISVVSIGVGLGLLFLILFVIAKRRQWKVRQSLARVSRRITARFSSHPNKPASNSEKPTLPVIEPRQPLGPCPAPSRRHQGFANLDAALQNNYRGVESVSGGAARNPEVWRKARAEERLQQSQGQGQRKKPELRVDTGVATRLEEGRGGVGRQKKSRGDWRDLFRAL
ncbi:hypothetical protein E4T49_01795 [Aureobasidium sp. EXF-10728]|nr:hypothetical protein E4T49_01795 [Aureobasidium sp. EXF-10728]